MTTTDKKEKAWTENRQDMRQPRGFEPLPKG